MCNVFSFSSNEEERKDIYLLPHPLILFYQVCFFLGNRILQFPNNVQWLIISEWIMPHLLAMEYLSQIWPFKKMVAYSLYILFHGECCKMQMLFKLFSHKRDQLLIKRLGKFFLLAETLALSCIISKIFGSVLLHLYIWNVCDSYLIGDTGTFFSCLGNTQEQMPHWRVLLMVLNSSLLMPCIWS